VPDLCPGGAFGYRLQAFGADPAVLADIDGHVVRAEVLHLEVLVAEGDVGQAARAELLELAIDGPGILDDEAEGADPKLDPRGVLFRADAEDGEVDVAVGEVDAAGRRPADVDQAEDVLVPGGGLRGVLGRDSHVSQLGGRHTVRSSSASGGRGATLQY